MSTWIRSTLVVLIQVVVTTLSVVFHLVPQTLTGVSNAVLMTAVGYFIIGGPLIEKLLGEESLIEASAVFAAFAFNVFCFSNGFIIVPVALSIVAVGFVILSAKQSIQEDDESGWCGLTIAGLPLGIGTVAGGVLLFAGAVE